MACLALTWGDCLQQGRGVSRVHPSASCPLIVAVFLKLMASTVVQAVVSRYHMLHDVGCWQRACMNATHAALAMYATCAICATCSMIISSPEIDRCSHVRSIELFMWVCVSHHKIMYKCVCCVGFAVGCTYAFGSSEFWPLCVRVSAFVGDIVIQVLL